MRRSFSPLELQPGQVPGLGLVPFPSGADALGMKPSAVPGSTPEDFGQCSESNRVVLAGGAFNTLLVHPLVTPFERLYRILPEEGMFDPDVSPERPFVVDLGSYTVPGNFDLLITDLRPDIYRYASIGIGDTVPVECRRYSSILGFDLTIDGVHPGNIELEVNPVPAQPSVGFAPPTTQSAAGFAALAAGGADPFQALNIARAQQTVNAPGSGMALLPQRPTRYGPLSVPFTLYARGSQMVRVRFVVFRPIPSPIAYVEYDIGGMILPSTWVRSMEECMKPLSNASGGPGSQGGAPR